VLEGPGIGELAVQANLAARYLTPAINDYPQAYHDPRNLWTVDRVSYFSLAYNTKLVPKDSVPKTYEDLLDPQWKGRMAWRIGTSGGMPLFLTTLRVAWGEEKAMAYFQRLRAQNLVNFAAGSARTLVDRVMAGEYPLAINIFAHHPLISLAKGAPVNSQLLDPVTTTSSALILVKGTRHPHASLLLIDYILSKEGQETLAKAEYYPAHPDVPALPMLDSVVPKRAGVPEMFITPEMSVAYLPSSLKIWEELFR
jgi:ABC-type Fe3+ transport system substrate-binding protein